MGRLIILELAILLLWSFASGDQQHLVCKTIQDVFTDDRGSASSSRVRRLQGPPGKTGTPGTPGIQGLPGPPGFQAVVDYDRISEVVKQKVSSAVAEIMSQITDLEGNVTYLTGLAEQESRNPRSPKLKTASDLPTMCKDSKGLYYHQKCYTIIVRRLNHSAAVSECADTGALLAEIHDQDQQDALYNLVVSRVSAKYLWVGMEYQSGTSTLLFRSGKNIDKNLLTWWDGFPTGSKKYMAIGQYKGSTLALWNLRPTHVYSGVICEKYT